MWDISVEGLRLIRDRVERHAIDCDLHWGQLHVAIKERQRADLLAERQELEDRYGYRQLRFMERAEVESLLATKRYCAGLYDAGSGHLHPLNYTLRPGRGGRSRRRADLRDTQRVTRLHIADPCHRRHRARQRAGAVRRVVLQRLR